MVDTPDLNEFVFVRVLQDVPGEVVLSNDDSVDLQKGNIYVLPYKAIRKFLRVGEVELV